MFLCHAGILCVLAAHDTRRWGFTVGLCYPRRPPVPGRVVGRLRKPPEHTFYLPPIHPPPRTLFVSVQHFFKTPSETPPRKSVFQSPPETCSETPFSPPENACSGNVLPNPRKTYFLVDAFPPKTPQKHQKPPKNPPKTPRGGDRLGPLLVQGWIFSHFSLKNPLKTPKNPKKPLF